MTKKDKKQKSKHKAKDFDDQTDNSEYEDVVDEIYKGININEITLIISRNPDATYI